MLGSWLDRGCFRLSYFSYTRFNFIIKQLIHGNISPIGRAKGAFDLVAPQQSNFVTFDLVSCKDTCLSGFVANQGRWQLSEASESREK